MGWFEDFGNAVSSGVAAVGDAVEAVVETVTETAENVVDAVTNTAEETVDNATDWLVQNSGNHPVRKFIVNVFVGIVDAVVNSVITVVRGVIDGWLHLQEAIGRVIGSVLRLDIIGAIQAVLDIFIAIVEIALVVFQFVTLGTFFGKLISSFERNQLKDFVEVLLDQQFTGKRLESVRKKLNMDGYGWGLTCEAHHKVFTMDSRTFPLAALHNNGKFDLFAVGGLPTWPPVANFRPRFTIKYITNDGGESPLPATRYHISKFLETGKPDLKVYAKDGSELRDSLDFANRHFRQAAIRFNWDERIIFPRQHTPLQHPITTTPEFETTINSNSADFIGTYLATSGLKPTNESNLVIRAQTSFNLFDIRTDPAGNFNGLTTGIAITEDTAATTACVVELEPSEGAGVTTRNVYPSWFSKIVLAHELGHYFGLCHINHNGVQNIMFTAQKDSGNSILDVGLINYYMKNEPDFSFEDKKNMWRFIVTRLGDQL
jgi:hypothetical protein